jgi:transcriptional regulator with XRE-family HTH domain
MAKTEAALERGERLRALRKEIGLTRLELSKEMNVSEHTIKAFEIGARELPAQKAREYCNLLLFAGIDITFDFIFHGKQPDTSEQKEDVVDDDRNIQKEIIYFKKNNPSSIIFKIQDSLMSPLYNKGDIVGGQKITNKNNFSLLTGHICIIEATNGTQRLRRVIKSKNQKITSCTLKGRDENINPPIIEEIEAFSIAQITRHWHLSALIRNLHTQSPEKIEDFPLEPQKAKTNEEEPHPDS